MLAEVLLVEAIGGVLGAHRLVSSELSACKRISWPRIFSFVVGVGKAVHMTILVALA